MSHLDDPQYLTPSCLVPYSERPSRRDVSPEVDDYCTVRVPTVGGDGILTSERGPSARQPPIRLTCGIIPRFRFLADSSTFGDPRTTTTQERSLDPDS